MGRCTDEELLAERMAKLERRIVASNEELDRIRPPQLPPPGPPEAPPTPGTPESEDAEADAAADSE